MIAKYRRTTLKWAVAALALTLVVGCSSLNNPINNSQPQNTPIEGQQNATVTPSATNSATANSNSVLYQNTQFGFNIVFGINKGEQIFEIRSYDSKLKGITLDKTKKELGNPAYDVKSNGQEIIGYKAGSEFKIEMVFPQPTNNNPNPVIDHYNVLYPQGTVNSMADDPGRQW